MVYAHRGLAIIIIMLVLFIIEVIFHNEKNIFEKYMSCFFLFSSLNYYPMVMRERAYLVSGEFWLATVLTMALSSVWCLAKVRCGGSQL